MRTAEYFIEKQKQFEQIKRQNIIDHARQESELLRKIEEDRARQKAQNLLLFRMWSMADCVLMHLEQQRDSHEPKHIDDEWDEDFCNAIRKIPDIRRLRDDLLFAWTNIDRHEYCQWI